MPTPAQLIGQLFLAEAAKGDFVIAVLAAKVRDDLRATDPQLLEAWLHENEVSLLAHSFGKLLQSERAIARHRGGARRFAAALGGGTSAAQLKSMFDVPYVIDDANTWRRMGDMTGPDHLFVAGAYNRSARTDLMLAAFHEAVAKKVKGRRTEDVLSETALQNLHASIVGAYGPATAAVV